MRSLTLTLLDKFSTVLAKSAACDLSISSMLKPFSFNHSKRIIGT